MHWAGRNSAEALVTLANTPVSAVDEGNDSDVSLLIANDGNEDIAIADNLVLLQDETGRDSQPSSQQAVVVPHNDIDRSLVESCLPVAEVGQGRDDQGHRRRRRHHRHRFGSSRQRDRLHRLKSNESNLFSAVFNLIVVVLTCVAMFEPRWFHIQGGRCTDGKNTVSYLGIKTFFESDNGHPDMFYYGHSQALIHCVTSDVIAVMRIIIALCFLVLISSLAACILDVVGSTRAILKVIRSTASLSILSVCICIVVTGMCYLATQQLTGYFEGTRMHEGSRVVVEFDIGFYMITAAGAVSVIAVGSTLLQVYNPSPSSSRGWSRGSASDSADRRREQLLHDADACRLSQAIHTRIQPPRAPPPYRP